MPKVLEVLRGVQTKFNKRGGKEDADECEIQGVEDMEGEDEDEIMYEEDIDKDSYMSEESFAYIVVL